MNQRYFVYNKMVANSRQDKIQTGVARVKVKMDDFLFCLFTRVSFSLVRKRSGIVTFLGTIHCCGGRGGGGKSSNTAID